MIYKDCGSYRPIPISLIVDPYAHRLLAIIPKEPAKTNRVPGEDVQTDPAPLRPISVAVGSALERLDAAGFRSVASRLLRHVVLRLRLESGLESITGASRGNLRHPRVGR